MAVMLNRQVKTTIQCKNSIKELSLKNNELDVKLTLLVDNNLNQYKLEGKDLNGDKKILEKLKELSQNTPILIFKMDEYSCETCIESAFACLKSIDDLNRNTFFILANFSDERRFNSFKKIHKEYNIVNIRRGDGLFFEKKDEFTPPLFAIVSTQNNELKMSDMFFYIKELPEYSKQCINLMKDRINKISILR